MPGIGNFGKALHVAADVDRIADAAVDTVAGRQAGSFRVVARRADKRFPTPSPDIERIVGRRVQDATGWPVDLSHAGFVIRVDVLTDEAYVFVGSRNRAPGGCPSAPADA